MKCFFFVKKKQKTFARLVLGELTWAQREAIVYWLRPCPRKIQEEKFFASFFQKRSAFLLPFRMTAHDEVPLCSTSRGSALFKQAGDHRGGKGGAG